MDETPSAIAHFAQSNFRGRKKIFGISTKDRHHHIYVIGKTGTGKSTLMETLMQADARLGLGFALFDPHGDLAQRVIARLPDARKDDLIYLNLPDRSSAHHFNPLSGIPPAARARTAAALLEAFKKIWAESWGPRLEHLLRNVLLALVEQPNATFADVPRLLEDASFRRSAAGRVLNEHVRHFWLREYESYPARFRAEVIAPLQNKIGAFLTNPIVSRFVCVPQSTFSLAAIMNSGKILVLNLSKGQIGEDAAALIGAFLIARINAEALSRAEMPLPERRSFFVYLDEFQTFTTLSLVTMLSEVRKYHIGLILANQYLTQLDPLVRDAILGNVGTLISFRVGVADAEVLALEFYPTFKMDDLVNLPNHSFYLRLMINGHVSKPFSADSLPPSHPRR